MQPMEISLFQESFPGAIRIDGEDEFAAEFSSGVRIRPNIAVAGRPYSRRTVSPYRLHSSLPRESDRGHGFLFKRFGRQGSEERVILNAEYRVVENNRAYSSYDGI